MKAINLSKTLLFMAFLVQHCFVTSSFAQTGSAKKDIEDQTDSKAILFQLGFLQEVDDNEVKASGAEAHLKYFINKSKTDRIYMGFGGLFFFGKEYHLLQPHARAGIYFPKAFGKIGCDLGLNASSYTGKVKDEKLEIQSLDIGCHMGATFNVNKKILIYLTIVAPALVAPAADDTNISTTMHASVGITF